MIRRPALLLSALAIYAVVLAGPTAARADIVFTNFGPSFLYDVTEGNPIGNGQDGTTNNYAEGETFTPINDYTLSTIYVALSDAAGSTNTDPLIVNLTTDAGDQPGTVLESFTIAPGTLGTLGANNAPIALTSLLNPALTAGTQYWVTVSDALGIDAFIWNQNNSGDSADQAQSSDGGATWLSPSGNTPGAFEVDGTLVATVGAITPEPGSLVLLGSGALAFFGSRWRRLRS